MQVNKIDKKAEMSLLDIVKYQIISYCYFQRITISDAVALCLSHLAIKNDVELSTFCKEAAELKLFATPQVVRNTMSIAEEKKLIVKSADSKTIAINPTMKIVVDGNILLDFKILYRESNKS